MPSVDDDLLVLITSLYEKGDLSYGDIDRMKEFLINPQFISRPDDSIRWKNLGNTALKHGDSGIALRCYANAIQIQPDNLDAWHNIVVVLTKTGRTVEAEKCRDRIKEIQKTRDTSGQVELPVAHPTSRDDTENKTGKKPGMPGKKHLPLSAWWYIAGAIVFCAVLYFLKIPIAVNVLIVMTMLALLYIATYIKRSGNGGIREKRSKIKTVLIIVGVVILFNILLAAIISVIIGMAGGVTVSPNDTPVVIERGPLPQNYHEYNNSDLHISVDIPDNWDAYVVDKNDIPDLTHEESFVTMKKIVYFLDKNTDRSRSILMVMGRDYTNSRSAAQDIQKFSEGIVAGSNLEIFDEGGTNVTVNPMENYIINGKEARICEINYITSEGTPSTVRITTIKNGLKFYSIIYLVVNDEYNRHINDVNTITKSFTIKK